METVILNKLVSSPISRMCQNRKTKWITKILVIPFTTFPVLIAASVTLAIITRKSEHQKAVARRQGWKSALADHVIKTNHDIAWDGATILRTNNNWHQRKILEAWEINCAKDPLNRDDGALLPKEYLNLTLAIKKKWHISWILISVLLIYVILQKFFFHYPWRRSVIATETSGTFL